MSDKKKCAVFTIVKNEDYFLPIWLKHYKKYFNKEDIYVLDHQSNDGSTDDLDVNKEVVINELAFDHKWLVDTVQDYQRKLLDSYRAVLFVEADELIYTLDKPLDETIDLFLQNESCLVQTCKAREVKELIGVEKQLLPDDEIFKHRNYWFEFPMYNKTLLSKVPLNWLYGFHCFSIASDGSAWPDTTYELQMVHLHRCDFELMLKRHQERALRWNLKDDGNCGTQHKIGDRAGVLHYFNSTGETEEIPQDHKKALIGI